jgi:hypothetical protein
MRTIEPTARQCVGVMTNIAIHEDTVSAWNGHTEVNLPANWRDIIGPDGRLAHIGGTTDALVEWAEGDLPPRSAWKEKVRNGRTTIYRKTLSCGCWMERTRNGAIWNQEPCCAADRADVNYMGKERTGNII